MTSEHATPQRTRMDITGHPAIFHVLLAINLALPFATHFYPTLDGPGHLYNARLLLGLFTGDAAALANHAIHPLPVPNWLDHAALAALLAFLPAWLAEKAFVLLYIAAMAFGFRALLKTIAPERIAAAPLIFPLIHSSLFHFGFFNFCWGVALLLWLLAYAWRPDPQTPLRRTATLAVLATLLWTSNVLTFALGGFLLGWRVLLESWRERSDKAAALRRIQRGLLPVAIAFLPGLICFVLFMRHTTFNDPDPPRSFAELLQWLVDARPMIAFRYAEERVITVWFSIIIGLLVLLAIVRRSIVPGRGGVLVVPMAIVLLLYFITPDSAHAGMMNDRYCLLFFTLLTTWVAVSAPPLRATRLLVIAMAVPHLILLHEHWSVARAPLDQRAVAMHAAAEAIPRQATVYPVNLSGNWLDSHLSSYLGVDRDLIILQNYEARLGWFPVIWSPYRPVQRCLPGKVPYGVRCLPVDAPGKAMPVDHVVVHGDTARLAEEDWLPLRSELERAFTLTHASADGQVLVYARARQ